MLRIRRNKGVTLIEVNLAMGVLLFGIISVFSLFPVGLRLADEGFKESDATFIGEMARSKVEFLINAYAFEFPTAIKSDTGRFGQSSAEGASLPVTYLKRDRFDKFITPKWSSDEWAGGYVQIMSGPEQGRFLRIASNGSSTLTFTISLRDFRILEGDELRVVTTSPGTTRSIPEDFFDTGSTIPTINALEFNRIRSRPGGSGRTLEYYRPGNARALADRGDTRYSYAMVFGGRDPDSPDLFVAEVLVFKDHTDAHPYSDSFVPTRLKYTFYYRRGLLFNK